MAEKKLMLEISPSNGKPPTKVTVVGTGQVGMAVAYSLTLKNVATEIAMVDINEDRLKGEVMDLQHGQFFTPDVTITGSTDYAVTKDSAICVVTAGARQHEGQTRLDLVQKNVSIFKNIIPNLVKYSPKAILLIVSNPVDVLTWVAWKLSGLPRNRVFGSGTMLDSSRLRLLLGQRFGVSPSCCHAYIIGEHGDSSVPVWSSVAIAGTRLRQVSPKCGLEGDPENWDQLHRDVVNSAYEIIQAKGHTNWATGLMVSTLCGCILRNEHRPFCLTTNIKGLYDMTESTFMSVPCVVGENGISHVLLQALDETERAKVMASAKLLLCVQKTVVL